MAHINVGDDINELKCPQCSKRLSALLPAREDESDDEPEIGEFGKDPNWWK
jgi:hypothetical protein